MYRKPIFSGVYSNFKSFIDIRYKFGLLHTLLYRIYSICSDYTAISVEIEKLKNICRKNRYPDRLVDKCICMFFEKLFIKKQVVLTVPKKKLIISLEYLGQQSIIIKKQLEQIIRSTISYCDVNVVFTSNNRLLNSFSFKNRIPNNLKSYLIYEYTCCDCDVTYIGKTYRHFQIRFSEHLGISKLTNKTLTYNKNTATAIRNHIHTRNHNSNSESFKIIGHAKNDNHLLIKESLNIQKKNPILNKTVKSYPLYLFN